MKNIAAALAVLACVAVVSAVEFAPGVKLIDEVTPNEHSDRCTTIAAGRKATDEDFTVLTYTADCAECDNRVMKIPAMDHKKGDKKKIIDSLQPEYPRYVGDDRGKWYKAVNKDQNETAARAFTPQVNHTYAYFDSVYGVMNEHGLGMGESSCYSRIAVGRNSTAVWEIAELSRVALERCTTARCAIKLMGRLAEESGFYGDDGEYGEALSIIDNEETWMFEISGTPKADSAVWVAQRVPDDHIAVCANSYKIREIDTDSDDFMYSSNIFSLAEELGFYNPKKETFVWAKHYAPVSTKPAYSDRRVWRVFDLAAPSLKLNAHLISDTSYPFSVKVDKQLPLKFFMELNRDFYEGTEFDLTKGLAAGPWSTPFRQEGGVGPHVPQFERAISIHRTSYSLVVAHRHNVDPSVGSVAWFAPDAPHASCYVPLYAGAEDVAEPYATGSLKAFERNAWWAFDFLANWINFKFSMMIKDVRQMQEKFENKFFEQDKIVREKFFELKKTDSAKALEYVSKYVIEESTNLVTSWWKFSDDMIVKYNDGYVNDEEKLGKTTPYTGDWMELFYEDQNSENGLLSEIKSLKAEVKSLKNADKAVAPATRSSGGNTAAVLIGMVLGAAVASSMFAVFSSKKKSGYSPLA